MPLFSNPVTLNDGNVDRTFAFRAQIADEKSIIGEWVEPAAALELNSKLTIKHDERSPTVRRRLVQRRAMLSIGTETKPITINFTVTHHPNHTLSQINAEAALLRDALAETNFLSGLLHGYI